MARILELAGVRKSYNVGTPVEVEVLHGIDLALDAGEFAALIGPSGSGKSTLLHIIGLLEKPSSGRLSIAGRAIDGLDEVLRAVRIPVQVVGGLSVEHAIESARKGASSVVIGGPLVPGDRGPGLAATLREIVAGVRAASRRS